MSQEIHRRASSYQFGANAGRRWAQEAPETERSAIRKLADELQRKSVNWVAFMEGIPGDAYTPGERIFFLIRPQQPSRQAAAQWWAQFRPPTTPVDVGFVSGWVDGVLTWLDERASEA